MAKIGNLDALLSNKPKVAKPEKLEEDVVEKIEDQVDDFFDIAKVTEALNMYSENLANNDQSRLQSIFKFMDVSVEEDVVRIQLNKQHRIQMEDIKIDFLSFLRKQLNNSKLVLELEDVQQTAQEKKPYTSVEKFEVMAKANPDLQALKDALGLKIE